MTPAPEEKRFAWMLTQDRIDMLVRELYALEVASNTLAPMCPRGERVGRLITDLRAQVVCRGADDPLPDMPMFPAFDDTLVTLPLGLWGDFEEEVAQ